MKVKIRPRTTKTVETVKKPRFVIAITGEINEEQYNYVLERAGEYIANKQHFSGITVLITSLGGFAYIGMAIYDLLKSLNADIYTVALGGCASAATIIFALGNKRFVSEHLSFLIHTSRIEFSNIVTMKEVNYLGDTIKTINDKLIKILNEYVDNEDFKKRLQDTFENMKEDYISVDDLLSYGLATDTLKNIEDVF